MKLKLSEVDLSKRIIEYLERDNWVTYKEVHVGKVADIVAVRNNITWIIECKVAASLRVIEQAYEWIGYSNYISVAVQYSNSSHFFGKVLSTYGIGSIIVRGFDVFDQEIPRLNRKLIKKNISKYLCDEQKIFSEAGNNEHKFITEFGKTKRRIIQYVSTNEGCRISDVIENVSTHYRSKQIARQCLANYILKKVIKEIDFDEKGRLYINKGVL